MILFKKSADLRKWLDSQHEKGYTTGFVPTMGALHRGHISLIETASSEHAITVCSIFVNPTQFNDPADFAKYPKTIDQDIRLLEEAGCNVLFLPEITEVYPHGTKATQKYELGYLETVLEGKFRPGHFQGVCMVVHRLLDLVRPHGLYLGQKDYQQCMVITKLVELINPVPAIKVSICPTLREPDGLAMSSRNRRLDKTERDKAATISRVLKMLKEKLQPGELLSLKEEAKTILEKSGFKIDYVAIANADDLSLKESWNGTEKIVALVAAFMNDVRLIDNMLLN